MSREGRHFSLITISAGLFATSVSSFGADPVTGYSTAIAVPSYAAPSRRPVPAHPIDPPDTHPNRSLQRARIVDQLYEEIMRPSGCFLVSNASITGGC